jgi:hypothetical protein
VVEGEIAYIVLLLSERATISQLKKETKGDGNVVEAAIEVSDEVPATLRTQATNSVSAIPLSLPNSCMQYVCNNSLTVAMEDHCSVRKDSVILGLAGGLEVDHISAS